MACKINEKMYSEGVEAMTTLNIGTGLNKKKDPVYKCTYEQCLSTFSRPFRLEAHLRVHLGEKPFICSHDLCNKTYTNKAHLVRHIQTNHMETQYRGNYICPVCKETYSNRQNLNRHIIRLHEKQKLFQCSFCTEQFQKHHILATHMFSHTGLTPFICDECDSGFIKLSQMNKHKKKHKLYACSLCNEQFTLWSKLLKHKKEMHCTHDFVCDNCHKQFKSKEYLKRHLVVHTNPDQRLLYTCTEDNCSMVYSTRSNLVHHVNSVHKKITFDCNLCDAKLATKQKLDLHIVKHSRSRPETAILKIGKKRRCRKDKGFFKSQTIAKLCPTGMGVGLETSHGN